VIVLKLNHPGATFFGLKRRSLYLSGGVKVEPVHCVSDFLFNIKAIGV
jgi:hypothetical protein